MDLLRLNNTEFHVEFEKAARVNQSSVIAILRFINDCERRKSYLELGYSSVFSYCVRKLEYSSSTSGRYIQAARCIHLNPEMLPMLEKRELTVSTICQIASILNDGNKQSVLDRVRGASRREVERIACDYRPPAAFRDQMVPVRVASRDGVQTMMLKQCLVTEECAEIFEDVRNLLSGSGEVTYGEIDLTVFREFRDRHSPIARQQRREKKKGSASLDSHQRECGEKKRSASLHSHRWECEGATNSRHIPDEVRDVVFMRDGGQCTFVAPDGTRCESRRVQVDHIDPFANDGATEMSNLRLLCGGHNRLMAERTMGRHVMQPYWRQP